MRSCPLRRRRPGGRHRRRRSHTRHRRIRRRRPAALVEIQVEHIGDAGRLRRDRSRNDDKQTDQQDGRRPQVRSMCRAIAYGRILCVASWLCSNSACSFGWQMSHRQGMAREVASPRMERAASNSLIHRSISNSTARRFTETNARAGSTWQTCPTRPWS